MDAKTINELHNLEHGLVQLLISSESISKPWAEPIKKSIQESISNLKKMDNGNVVNTIIDYFGFLVKKDTQSAYNDLIFFISLLLSKQVVGEGENSTCFQKIKDVLVNQKPEKVQPEEKVKKKEKPAKIPKIPKPLERVMDESLLLKRYGTTSVWKPVLDFVFDNVPDEFSINNASEQVGKYYKTVLKRDIKPSTQDAYASCYARYMKEELIPPIERCDDPNISRVVLYRRIRPEVKPSDRIKPETKPPIASSIYELANKAGWIKTGIAVSEEAIEKGLPYSSDEIKAGLARLVREGKVQQYSPSKVMFIAR